MASLPDESSAEFVPALKKEYERLRDEKLHAMSLNDQLKAMEARFQQHIDDKIDDLSSSMMDTISKAAGGTHEPGTAKTDPS